MSHKKESNYYAIITADVRYSDKLSSSEKLFFAEITALTNKTGECWASNKHFAELYGVDPSTVSKWVKKLQKNGFIKVRYVKEGKQIKERFISIIRGSENNQQGTEKIPSLLLKNRQGGIEKTPKSNTTRNNNTRKTTIKTKVSEITPEMNKVITCWNKTFDIEVDIQDKDLIRAIQRAVDKHSLKELSRAIRFRSLAKFYKERASHLRDRPESFFEYPQTIKNDMKRYPYKLITYQKKCELEQQGADRRFKIDPDRQDNQGRPKWRMYE